MTYLWDVAPIVVLRFGPHGEVVAANCYAQALLGTVLNKTLKTIALDFAGTTSLDELMKSPGPVMLNVPTVAGDPQTLFFSLARCGEDIYAFGGGDPHEMMRLQHQVLQLNGELNNVGRELHKRNAEMVQMDQLKSQFLGMAAHDLRKPLGFVLSVTELMLMDATDPEDRSLMEDVKREVLHMAGLINDFLDVSIIESGKLILKVSTIAADELLRRTVRVLAPYALTHNVQVKVDNELGAMPLALDESKIEQVLTNLATNAIEHSGTGTQITLAARLSGTDLLFQITDQGPGIATALRDRLFTAFAKGSSSRAKESRSVGLGLMISRKIVETHGGRIWVDSEPGQGATFSFLVPGNLSLTA